MPIPQSTTSCEQVSKPVTSSITYEECWEEEVLNCTEKVIEIPCQKKLHRKQCLLPEDHENNPDSHQHDEGKRTSHPAAILIFTIRVSFIVSNIPGLTILVNTYL